MATVFLAKSTEPLAAVLIERRKMEQQQNPDIDMRDQAIIKNGPRAYKVATHWVIIDRHTGEIHHHAVKVETYRRTKKLGWIWEPSHSITLEDHDGDETIRLATFLGAIHSVPIPTDPGNYLVVPVADQRVNVESVRSLLGKLSANGKVDAIAEILGLATSDPEVLRALTETATNNPDAAKGTAAALTIARYTAALRELEALIASDAGERRFQDLLEKNEWMFGSEYSARHERRTWTRDEEQDFMLRRTVDGYLELIEIKTALRGKPLFLYDADHKTYYQRGELSKVVGQVMHYLEKLDRDYYRIKEQDKENISKIRAKIIIGRDSDEQQMEALCRLNGHLHRIEVLTFDQLVRIAQRVLAYLETAMWNSEPSKGPVVDDPHTDMPA